MKKLPAALLLCAAVVLAPCANATPPLFANKKLPPPGPDNELNCRIPALNPDTPPLGLKTYADLNLIADEVLLAKLETAPPEKPAEKPIAPHTYARMFFQKTNQIRLIPADSRTLLASYSKDDGATWSVPRFLLQTTDGSALSDIEFRKLPGASIQLNFATGGRRLQVVFKQTDLPKLATDDDLRDAPPARFILESTPDTAGISRRLTIGSDINFPANKLPPGYRLDASLGLLVPATSTGQVIHTAKGRYIFETRATFTPNGDIIALFPDGGHASTPRHKVNTLLLTRSTNGGKTWTSPANAYGDDEKHWAPLFAISHANPERLYAFEAVHNDETRSLPSFRAFGYRTTDDNGRTWTPPQLIRRATGNPNHNGVGVIQMTVTPADTFLMGFHSAKMLRGALAQNGLREWTLVSPKNLTSPAPANYSMNELRLISTGGPNVLAFARTQEGRIWKMRSTDDGKTFSDPEPTSLVHPDSPPMIFHLNDGKTLAALIHNRAILRSVHEPCHSKEWTMPMPTPEKIALGNQHKNSYRDWVSRAELWVSLSHDNGETWTEPRFLMVNALAETLADANPNYNLAYTDLLARDGQIHLIIPHRWQRVIHLTFPEKILHTLSTKQQLQSINN